MKLAVSNLAWDTGLDREMYARLQALGFSGLELAPTKFFARQPYSDENIQSMQTRAEELRHTFGLSVVSLQSIWYGRTESIWGPPEERRALLEYTARAARFAAAAGCGNLVFGCPRHRNRPQGADPALAVEFFARAADAVQPYGVCLSLEPNPPIYGTNFLNTTAECAAFLRTVGHPALRMNLDVGTMIENAEDVDVVADNLALIHHVHISRPGLAPVQPLALHRRLADVLRSGGYTGWVSLEMKDAGPAAAEAAMQMVRSVFA